MFCNCEYCGDSMLQAEKSITQFGKADICSPECLSDANNDATTELPFRKFKQVSGFDSKQDLADCSRSAMEQEIT